MTTRAMVKVAQTGRRPAMLRAVMTAVAVATKAATWTISMTRMMAFMTLPFVGEGAAQRALRQRQKGVSLFL